MVDVIMMFFFLLRFADHRAGESEREEEEGEKRERMTMSINTRVICFFSFIYLFINANDLSESVRDKAKDHLKISMIDFISSVLF